MIMANLQLLHLSAFHCFLFSVTTGQHPLSLDVERSLIVPVVTAETGKHSPPLVAPLLMA